MNPETTMSKQHIIIDCDPGIDDALALMLACGSPRLILEAVTCVAGNRPLHTTALNAARILRACGQASLPVYAGCARPLAQAMARCNEVHGIDGLGGVALATGSQPQPEHACDVLIERLLHPSKPPVTIVAIGPLTNLAVAEIKSPGILRRAKSILVMGGAMFRPGNITPHAEFNFYADALAAQVVLDSGAPLKLFGLDVTTQAVMSPAWISALRDFPNSGGTLAYDMLQAYSALDPLLHDPCPVAYLLAPDLFGSVDCEVCVEWRNPDKEGHVWATRANDQLGANSLVSVVIDVDNSALLQLVAAGIGALP